MLAERFALFPTHIYGFVNANADTDHPRWRAAIHALRARDLGRSMSNVLGWQSATPLQDVPELEGLSRFVLSCLEETASAEAWRTDAFRFVTEGWININSRGASNCFHNHPNALLSAVYYLDAPRGCGDILFRDPREMAYNHQPPYADGRYRTPVKALTPAPGMLLIFPPWLLHAVDPNTTDAERISLAFNAGLEAARP